MEKTEYQKKLKKIKEESDRKERTLAGAFLLFQNVFITVRN